LRRADGAVDITRTGLGTVAKLASNGAQKAVAVLARQQCE
jgi:hypothetical protein